MRDFFLLSPLSPSVYLSFSCRLIIVNFDGIGDGNGDGETIRKQCSNLISKNKLPRADPFTFLMLNFFRVCVVDRAAAAAAVVPRVFD